MSYRRESNIPTVFVNCPTSFKSPFSTTPGRRPLSGKLPGADGAVGYVAAEVSPAEPFATRGGGGKGTVGFGGGGSAATGAAVGTVATGAAYGAATTEGAGGDIVTGA